jgi:large subunit ribosomal protein L16|tara:strand:- start:2331 stop:2735 length:405 start_codon:yes stop_codon:yes gene_type:complete
MLRPKQTKFRKQRKGKIRGLETRSNTIIFGEYGLKVLECGRISARQIEATRRAITRKVKRRGKLWIRMFPSVPVTAKPVEVRMGKGKGAVDHWVCPVKAGKILYEIGGLPKVIAYNALKSGSNKLSLSTRIVKL